MIWTLQSARNFGALTAAWDALNDAGPRSPALRSEFMAASIEFFATEKLRLAVCRNGDDICAMALVAPRRLLQWETLQPAQAPLGAFICKPDVNPASLMASLLTTLPGYPVLISVTQQDPDIWSRDGEHPSLSYVDYIETARITIDSSFDDYWQSRGKNLRHNVRRQRNRLDRDGVTTSLDVLRSVAEMADGVASYGVLEQVGWKGEQGTAVTPDNQQGRFYRMVLERFASTGDAVVFRYRYNDRIVAVDLCIRSHGTLIILKTTYDEAETQTSPAMLLRHAYFPIVFGWQDARRIEFYGRAMEWHRRWSSEIRQMFHVNVYRHGILRWLHEQRRSRAAAGEVSVATGT